MDDPTILSVDTVLRKTKANSLTEVRNINLWGCKLANVCPLLARAVDFDMFCALAAAGSQTDACC